MLKSNSTVAEPDASIPWTGYVHSRIEQNVLTTLHQLIVDESLTDDVIHHLLNRVLAEIDVIWTGLGEPSMVPVEETVEEEDTLPSELMYARQFFMVLRDLSELVRKMQFGPTEGQDPQMADAVEIILHRLDQIAATLRMMLFLFLVFPVLY